MNVPDIQELTKLLNSAREYFSDSRKITIVATKILDGLIIETLEQLKQGIDLANISFTYVDLHKMGWAGGEVSPEEASNKIRKEHIKKLKDLVDRESELSQFFLAKKFKHILRLESDSSVGGSRTQFWLNAVPLEIELVTNPNEVVVYRAKKLPKLKSWIRPLVNFVLKGWKVWAFASIPIFLIVSVPMLLLLFSKIETPLTKISILIVFVAIYFVGKIFYDLITKGISKAPWFTVKFSEDDAFFIMTHSDEKKESGRKYRTFGMVVYEAECPICGDAIYIENGGREFFGRYVGKCLVAPKEHIYTFDHVTKRGVPARINGYYKY